MKTASELLLESAEPFDQACILVKEMEEELYNLRKANQETLDVLREIVKISDRKHDAWDRAKQLLAKEDIGK